MDVAATLAEAAKSGVQVRLHTDDEVVVVRVLRVSDVSVLYEPVTSSRPERYAVCDAAGFELSLAAIERVTPVKRR